MGTDDVKRRRWPALAGGAVATVALAGLLVVLWQGGAVDEASGVGPASGDEGEGEPVRRVAVEAAAIERGALEAARVFSGSLEPSRRVVIASRVTGRIASLRADLGDAVERGDELARLDADEFAQEVAAAEAELAVARADLVAAEDRLARAERELERTRSLRERGVASESRLDSVEAEHQAAEAERQMAAARIRRHEANVAAARLRLGYTSITAQWSEDGGTSGPRLVSRRYVDDGDTVSANEPLFELVAIDPIKAVFHATPRDYTRLAIGQPVTLRATGHDDRTFEGRIDRVSPVFGDQSRQARVEVAVANADFALKPGMFAHVRVVLDTVEDAVIVPHEALTRRDGRPVVFVIDPDGERVRPVAVRVGIEQADRVQVIAESGEPIEGQVVTLGQQMLEDGTAVRVHR